MDIQPGLHVVLSETNGANVTRHVHSLRGIHAHKDAANNWEWPLQDSLGSVREVVDNSIAVLESRNYDPFGNGFGITGTSQTNYGFTGELVDGGGLLDLRARRYAPGLGVFASLDQFEGVRNRAMSLNGYSWVEGNVPNAVDPSGRQQDCNQGNCGLPMPGAASVNTLDGPIVLAVEEYVQAIWNGVPLKVAPSGVNAPLPPLGIGNTTGIARIVIHEPIFAAIDVAYPASISPSAIGRYFSGEVVALFDASGQHVVWLAISGQPLPQTELLPESQSDLGDVDTAAQVLEQYATCGVATRVENDVRYACGDNSIFRSMTEAPDGLPMTGASARILGARPGINADIPVISGNVSPNTGGMSVSPGSPFNIEFDYRRPLEFGGVGKDPVWCNDVFILIPFGLQYRPDPVKPLKHGFVEPAGQTTFESYQNALWATRPTWSKVTA